MKHFLFIVLLCLGFIFNSGCQGMDLNSPWQNTSRNAQKAVHVPRKPEHPYKKTMKARITFYDRFHDKWGSKLAMPGNQKAKEGITVAARKKTFDFNKGLFIPCLKFLGIGTGNVAVQDRGGAVEKLKASKGKCEVIDVYVEAPNKKEAEKRIASLQSAVGTNPVDIFY